ncbi:MAG: PLP-dependent transferase [Opitutales bacterium]
MKKVSGLGEFALGQAVPSRDHAVCVSLPTVNDLVGYEKKDPKTLSAMRSGYPRFVQHRFLRELIRLEEKNSGSTGNQNFLFTNSKHCLDGLEKNSIQNYQIHERENYTWLQLPEGSKKAANISSFVQHTGGSLSSRQAEEILLSHGCITDRESISDNENPSQFARKIIAEVHGEGVSEDKVLLSSSGANAFYSLFQTAFQHSLEKGKSIWIRLGWLYLDTIETMELVSGKEHEIIALTDLSNLDQLKEIFSNYGDQIAGVVTEFPTNPLLQSCDLEKVRELCNRSNALLIVDPTMASPKNVKVAYLSDVLVNSLTKYASWQGDLMIGSLVFPDHSKLGTELFESTKSLICPPFKRDLLRLCEQLPNYPKFVEKTNQTLIQVVEFLESHPAVKKVFWAYQKGSDEFFKQMAGDGSPGCVVSFEVKGNFESFYNQLQMLKSPSFGTEFSLCCPYVYLAHYKLLQTKEGLEILNKGGISPHLCRLSVGLENPEDIIQTLQDALQGME